MFDRSIPNQGSNFWTALHSLNETGLCYVSPFCYLPLDLLARGLHPSFSFSTPFSWQFEAPSYWRTWAPSMRTLLYYDFFYSTFNIGSLQVFHSTVVKSVGRTENVITSIYLIALFLYKKLRDNRHNRHSKIPCFRSTMQRLWYLSFSRSSWLVALLLSYCFTYAW